MGAGNQPGYWISLSTNDDSTILNNDLSAQAETSDGQVRCISAGSDKAVTMTNKYSTKKVFGGSVLGNDNLQGTNGTNPSELTIWNIGLQAIDGTTTVSVKLKVAIEYIAIWEEIKDVAQS